MNKAFVREPELAEYRCPKCGSLGSPVGRETLEAHLVPKALPKLAPSGFFCADPNCEVAYFDQFARSVQCDALRGPVYPKDLEAPICGCFGFTREDIEQDVQEGVATRCRELLAKAKSPDARCAIMAANGRSCVPEIQRYFMKCRAARQSAQSER
ncbi:MAG: hypothetical protein HY000_13945 [Planctomycetes bacterium]|nr:hypothetical protein [Planctomycetota bacterium]